jgi:hypothetical protein
MAKKIKEEKDRANMWRVWYEITDDDAEKPEAAMFKFKKKPTEAEIAAVANAFIAAKAERKAKAAELEALRLQIEQLEAELNP